jgi:putative modified peptide
MAKLSEKTLDAVLDGLSDDEAFRAAFQRNPREATRSLGTEDPAVETLPDQPLPNLADKTEFKRARGQVRKQLTEAMAPFIPITLDIPRA